MNFRERLTSVRLWGVIVIVAAALFSLAPALAGDVVFPQHSWQTKSPADLKLDPARLDAVALALGGRGCAIVDGYVVKSWGDQAGKSDWYSSAKPVLSTLLMFAIQEGLVASPDALIADYGWELAEKDRPMTFRHLGAMTSGYARPEPPGAAWSYNDFAIQLYQLTLFDRVFKQDPDAIANAPSRLGALQLEDGLSFHRNRRLHASARDFARLGWLWLNRGRWNDRQLLRSELVDDLLRPQVAADTPKTAQAETNDYLKIGSYGGGSDHFSKAGPGIYGFNFWFNARGGGHCDADTWPDAPADTVMTLGFGGNCLVMLPELRAVVACAEGAWGKNEPGEREAVMNHRLRLIADAVTPVEPQAAPVVPPTTAVSKPLVRGELKQWHTVELLIPGPAAGEADELNPFTDYRVDVNFSQGDRHVIVPAHLAADGNAAETGAAQGHVWRAYFTPDTVGAWHWQVSVRKGTGVALAADPAGEPAPGDGLSGSFEIASSDKTGRDFRAHGRLQYVGRRYLQFAGSGRYFFKGGADSPENLLAFAEIDGTPPSHRFGPHHLDAAPDDPTWRGGQGRNLFGALNYLAHKGVNSIYLLTMNVKGDGKDVWPWTSDDERLRYDVSKLDQWERVFAHCERLGIALHFVLQEQENDQLLDKGDLGPQRRLYHRELVSRFGHHLTASWNLGEENTNTTEQRLAFAEHLRQVDPYDHPIVIHTFPKQQEKVYAPLLASPWFDGVSLQTNDTRNQTCTWIDRSAAAGRQWVVSLDEIGPADTGVVPDSFDYNHDEVRRVHLWGHFMSGGAGVEWLFGYKYPHDDIDLEDFRSRDHMWDLTRYAVDFFTNHFPTADSIPSDELTVDPDDYCLAVPARAYAIYRPVGGTTDIELPAGKYTVAWFDPSHGGKLHQGTVKQLTGPGRVSIGLPHRDVDDDWVCLLTLSEE